MTKSELIERLAAQQTHLMHKDVELAVKLVLDQISNALARDDLRWVGRPEGTGTRVLLEELAQAAGLRLPRRFALVEPSHLAAAHAVASGAADVAFGLEAAALACGLDFLPLAQERYFLVTLKSSLELPALRRLIALLGGTTSAGDALSAMAHLLWPTALVDGGSITAFEAAFAARVGRRWGFSFLAGRVGLFGILQALGIGSGDEVLLQVPTHVVVANAIRYTGARPVFIDCSLDTFNLDLDEAVRRVTPRTRAIIVQQQSAPARPRASVAVAGR